MAKKTEADDRYWALCERGDPKDLIALREEYDVISTGEAIRVWKGTGKIPEGMDVLAAFNESPSSDDPSRWAGGRDYVLKFAEGE